jgi:mannose-6-phosphate isomerase-like protein (cupin superfamily)
MNHFKLENIRSSHKAGGDLYHEFLRVPSLNCGLYVLPAGGTDPQQPHEEDEVYYIIAGRGRFSAVDEDVAVEPGDILYVAAGDPHHFHSITEDLEILVFFASDGSSN